MRPPHQNSQAQEALPINRRRGRRFVSANGSVSVSQLKPIIENSEQWADEYIKRESRYRERGAHREAAHFEDLVCAHKSFAQSLRQLVWASKKRKPTLNTEIRRPGPDAPEQNSRRQPGSPASNG